MTLPKLTSLQQIGLTLAVGIVLAAGFLLDDYSAPEMKVRDLIPKEIAAGPLVLGEFGDKRGSALFEVSGSIPKNFHSYEPRLGIGRITRPKTKSVRWKRSPLSSNTRIGRNDCSCFACGSDAKSCQIAAEWLSKEGSLYYLSDRSEGTSYIVNRETRQIMVFWNRAL